MFLVVLRESLDNPGDRLVELFLPSGDLLSIDPGMHALIRPAGRCIQDRKSVV